MHTRPFEEDTFTPLDPEVAAEVNRTFQKLLSQGDIIACNEQSFEPRLG